MWADRRAINRDRTIPHGFAHLEASGALDNFRNAARGTGLYVGGNDDAGATFPFLDSDVYKWLEAVGWELGREEDAALRRMADAGHRAGRPAPAAGRLPGHVRPAVGPGTLQRPRSGATSCTASAISSRPPWPGIARWATTACWTWPTGPSTASTRSSGRTAATASTATPRSRWRSWSCTGVTGDDASPGPGAAPARPARARGCWAQGRFGAGYWQDHEPGARGAHA